MATCPTGSSYDPSAAVETFHGIPHTDIDLQDSPDQFDPSDTNYWEVGAGAPAMACLVLSDQATFSTAGDGLSNSWHLGQL